MTITSILVYRWRQERGNRVPDFDSLTKWINHVTGECPTEGTVARVRRALVALAPKPDPEDY